MFDFNFHQEIPSIFLCENQRDLREKKINFPQISLILADLTINQVFILFKTITAEF